MMKGEPLTAIVPVRAGSKGIPGKNLWRYGNVSLVERAVRLGLSSPLVDRVVISTDSPEMLALARAAGAHASGLRPSQLATDTATSADVVEYVLQSEGIATGHLLLLQATAPLRTRADLAGFLACYEKSGGRACASVTRHDEPRPEKLKRIKNGKLAPYWGEGFEGARQQLPQPYRLNGAFYAIAIDMFQKGRRFLPEGTAAYEMPAERSANLDTMEDLRILEAMLAAGHWHMED